MPDESDRHTLRTARPRGVRIGLILFVLGLLFIVIDVTPYFFDAHDTPLWLNLACLLAPLGFAVAGWAGIRAGRAEQRTAVRSLTESSA
jgi:hypothetical protein